MKFAPAGRRPESPRMVLEEIQHPIVLAPLAGGASTAELAAAVSEAGGLGFLASGYLTRLGGRRASCLVRRSRRRAPEHSGPPASGRPSRQVAADRGGWVDRWTGRRRGTGGRGRRGAAGHCLPEGGRGRHRARLSRRPRVADAHRTDARLQRPPGARHRQPLHDRALRKRSLRLSADPLRDGSAAGSRAEARRSVDGFNLWAGQAHELGQSGPAAEILRSIIDDARKSLEAAANRAL